MIQSSVVWVDAAYTIPADTRDVLIVIAYPWEVRIGNYYDGGWITSKGAVKVKYWADFPSAPNPEQYD